MTVLNQFQTYSQKENTITNNVLLMLSNIYSINPSYYEDFISGLTDDPGNYEVIPSFLQQRNNRGDGIIDGFIQVKASKIIIETKKNSLEGINKLVKYAKSFDSHETKLLFHLSSKKYNQAEQKRINSELGIDRNIQFYSLTYQDLVDQLEALAANYPYESYLQRLNLDFKGYCLKMNLMPGSKHILRAMACGQSYDLNVKHQFYFDLASRGYSSFNYLGIYKWKAVRYIGKVENNIEANWDEKSGLDIVSKTNPVTEEHKVRLAKAIQESVDNGWKIGYGHRFFLLNDLYETKFVKTSPGGIFRVRYFDLEKEFGKVPENIKDIASELSQKTWK